MSYISRFNERVASVTVGTGYSYDIDLTIENVTEAEKIELREYLMKRFGSYNQR